jgi:spore coat protein U-like protein
VRVKSSSLVVRCAITIECVSLEARLIHNTKNNTTDAAEVGVNSRAESMIIFASQLNFTHKILW